MLERSTTILAILLLLPLRATSIDRPLNYIRFNIHSIFNLFRFVAAFRVDVCVCVCVNGMCCGL